MSREKKTPLLRLAKRDGMEGWKVWCIRAGSILFALLLGALVMALAGANPVTAYGAMISGALGKKSAIRQTVKIAVPLLGCALAIAPCFKMRFWNIGAEGQITAGAIAASYFALFWANRLPSPVLGVHCGWIIVLVLVVFMHIYMNHTKHGYEIAVIGDSVNTARYAGMNVGRVMMRTMFLSGAISGLVGFIVASGANNTLYDGVAGGVGFTSITVAWLSQLNAFAMVGISGLLAVLSKGAETLQTRMAVPTSISDIITGILLFCMLGCEFFINYKLIFRGAGRKEARHG